MNITKFFVIGFFALTLIGCTNSNVVINPDEPSPAKTTNYPDSKPQSSVIKRDGPIKITIFFDFQCEYCRQSVKTMRDLKNEFGDKVEIRYVHFPSKIGSKLIAEASECARDQGKFEEFYKTYFETYFLKSSKAVMKEVATNIGLDMEEFGPCLNSGIKKPVVTENRNLAQKLGAQAVPFFVIDDVKLTGSYPFSTLQKIVQKKLDEDE